MRIDRLWIINSSKTKNARFQNSTSKINLVC